MATSVSVTSIVRTIRGKANSLGGYKIVVADLTFDDTYAAGGIPIAASDFGLTALEGLLFMGDQTIAGAYLYAWDVSAGKIKAYNSSGSGDPFDESGADDQTGQAVRVVALGY